MLLKHPILFFSSSFSLSAAFLFLKIPGYFIQTKQTEQTCIKLQQQQDCLAVWDTVTLD
uniref:Uncharacterized protein n=1 Tax=Anguilla anguilla TaxID=7936 RepID=A0A0E9WUU6_ANGAN